MRQFFLTIATIALISMALGLTIYWKSKYDLRFEHPMFGVGDILPVSSEELQKIAGYKFYVLLVDRDDVFIPRYYLDPLIGATKKMGGLMEVVGRKSLVSAEIFKHREGVGRRVFSVVIITDKDARIVGVYPNEEMDGIVGPMKQHPNLIDLHLAGTAL